MCGKPGHRASVCPSRGRLQSLLAQVCEQQEPQYKNRVLGSLLLHVGREINLLGCKLMFLWVVFAIRAYPDHGFWWEMMWRLRLCSNSHTVIGLSLAPLCVWDANLCLSLLCKNLFNQNCQTYSMTIVLIYCSLTLYVAVA